MWYAVGVFAAILSVVAAFVAIATFGPLAGLVTVSMAAWLVLSAYRWLLRRVGTYADAYDMERRSLTK